MTTMATQGEGRKRRKYSKNKKKSLRKYTDISEVEEHLEDKRLQERTGGLVAEKTNEQLFFVDTVVKEELLEAAVPRKRKRKEVKPLKCHALLQPNPNIKPAVIVTDTYDADPTKKKSVRVSTREKAGVISTKTQSARQNRATARSRKQQMLIARKLKNTVTYDIWGDSTDTKSEAEHQHMKATRQTTVKKPLAYRAKPVGVAAIEPAHPGASYNPTYADHQELLRLAYETEVEKEKEEKRISNALDRQFPKASEYSEQEAWLKDMSQGLKGKDEDEAASSSDEDEEELATLTSNPPVRRENKKTLRQRRKEKLRLEKEAEAKKEKGARMKKSEIFRLKSLKKEVEARERQLAARKQRKVLKAQSTVLKTRKLGKLKYEAASLEIKLTDELEGSLRHLKPEGNLIEDRFNSLQKRNIIESRLPSKQVKKYKRKKFTRKTHAAMMQ